MALKRYNKSLLLLFGVGTASLLYGLGYAYIENCFSKSTAAVSVIGVVCIIMCVFTLKKNARKSTKASHLNWKRYGFIVLVIALFGSLFTGVNYLSYRYNFRLDLTKSKQHTLTDRTAHFIKELKQEVKIIAFYVGIPPKYIEDIFKEYERLSNGKIKTEIIDPIVQIGYAAQFGSVISGKERKVIVRSENEREDIDFTYRPLSEEQLTNAVIRVTRDKRIVYFLTGHGEYSIFDDNDKGMSILKKLLAANNIEAKKLMLGIQGNIPEDCNVLIIAGPRNQLVEKEEEIIKSYLENGGDALFLIENTPVTTPGKPLTEEEKRKNPSMNSILNHWGLKIEDDMAVDLTSHIGSDVGCPATRNYMKYDAIAKNLDYTFYIRPRSISNLRNLRKSIKITPLVLTASEGNSWAETNKMLHVKFDKGADRPGPVVIAAVVHDSGEESGLSDTRIVVFTDADFLSNAFISQYSNARMGLNVINWLSKLDYQVFIDQKEIKVERLDLTSRQKRMVMVFLVIMVAFIAVIGIMVWVRHKS